jgi:bifunctional UDP-N-acetylglucosamine pyrophosphorylase/glucosamine-1-phosphate N-acetyltransferase/UDP-N-acetylglucosamine pyrophosphorylase
LHDRATDNIDVTKEITMNDAVAVVLAAGKGTRMESELPKVLVPACGRPMIEYVLDTLEEAGIARVVVVVGYRADEVRRVLAHRSNVTFVEQTQQLGTGHAVMVCRDELAACEGPVLVVTGDSPMLQLSSVRALLDRYERDRPACILGTLHKGDPRGLGRIVRDSQGAFLGIVEEKDATPEQRSITEVNMSTYVFHAPDLRYALDRLQNNNAQKEYYITDCPGILRQASKSVLALPVLQPCEALSVNNMAELRVVEDAMRAMGRCTRA